MEAMHSLNISASAKALLIFLLGNNCDAMNDDFNTPILIAQLFEGVRFINILKDGKETLNTEDLKSFEKAMTDLF
jgi:cysteinyl-tRNA synthetase